MKIKNRKKFVARISELIILLVTIALTPMIINYATVLRGHTAYGGEYLVPIFGLLIMLVIETIYEESEEKKRGGKHEKIK